LGKSCTEIKIVEDVDIRLAQSVKNLIFKDLQLILVRSNSLNDFILRRLEVGLFDADNNVEALIFET
jgi:hypothetical protein